MATDYIQLAYAVSRKGGTTYRARAYVALHFGSDKPIKNNLTIALGDTREEAETEALRYIRESYARDDLTAPEEVRNAGKLCAALVDGYHF